MYDTTRGGLFDKKLFILTIVIILKVNFII